MQEDYKKMTVLNPYAWAFLLSKLCVWKPICFFCVYRPSTLVLLSGSCDNVNLHGKRNFADVIKDKNLELGRLDWIIQVYPI